MFRIGTLLEVGPRLPWPPAAHPLHRSGALPPLPPPRAWPHARARAQLARELATTLASDGKRVKVSVQQALGAGVFQARCRAAQVFSTAGFWNRVRGSATPAARPAQGMPLSLSGVRRIMERMDWGDAGAFVGFGEVGADQIDSDCDYYILIAPQNVVGACRVTGRCLLARAGAPGQGSDGAARARRRRQHDHDQPARDGAAGAAPPGPARARSPRVLRVGGRALRASRAAPAAAPVTWLPPRRQVEAAEAQGKVVILLCAHWRAPCAPKRLACAGLPRLSGRARRRNPLLKDIPSHSSVMGVRCAPGRAAQPAQLRPGRTARTGGQGRTARAGAARRGRAGRLAFAASFTPAYHFRLLYMSSQMAYPIMGALRHAYGSPWEARRPARPGPAGARTGRERARVQLTCGMHGVLCHWVAHLLQFGRADV